MTEGGSRPVSVRIFLKFTAVLACVLAGALLAADWLAWRVVRTSHIETLARRLEQEAQALVQPLWSQGGSPTPETFREAARLLGVRLTAIRRDGTVVADSQAGSEAMENHAGRPEIARALAGGVGRSVRDSPTLGVPFLYVAVPAPMGALRAAAPLSEIETRLSVIRARTACAIALAFVPALVLAAVLARRYAQRLGSMIDFSARLAQGDFEARLQEGGAQELRVLARQLNQTGEKLKGMLEELRRERSELQRLERIRRDFVVNVSHELRTPVASIQGYAETLLDGALEEPSHRERFLRIIQQNAERLGRLIDDLLALSRLELGTREFSFASYRLCGLLEESLDVIRPLAARKHVQLRLAPPGEDLEVFCDPQAVQQVLSNLLDNAVKFSPEGGVVTLGARLGAGASYAEVYVEDQGPGIPPEDLPRLFERFYRVDKARSRELGGTGLGLAIVKHLVLAHGGEVRVESRLGRGSVFYFTLPLEHTAVLSAPAIQTDLTVL